MSQSNIEHIINRAFNKGIDFILGNNTLKLKIPQGEVIDQELLNLIKANKEGISAFLQENGGSAAVKNHRRRITKYNRTAETRIPLSFSQERLWFIDQLGGSTQYHISTAWQLLGNVNADALEYAFKNIVNRHEVLRTIVEVRDGEAGQCVLDKDGFTLNIVDTVQGVQDDAAVDELISCIINDPVDLTKDQPLRVHLISVSSDKQVLIVTMHHIASDAWSMMVFFKEFVTLYNAYVQERPVQLPSLEIQYADYAIWQREYLKGETLTKKLSYWQEQLSGVAALNLPTDFVRPTVQRTRGAVHRFEVDAQLKQRIQQLCRQEQTTLFMTLLAAFKVLLYRYSGQEDICVGSPIAGRMQQETEGLIGFFVNTLALRSPVSGKASFVSLLQQVKETMLRAYAHQDAPFEKVVEAVVKERDLSRSPLFQVMFNLQNDGEAAMVGSDLHGVKLLPYQVAHNTSLFDMNVSLTETKEGISGAIEYCTDLYTPETIGRMAAHYEQLLRSITTSPDQQICELSMLTQAERHQLLVDFNDTKTNAASNKTIVTLFEEQAACTPESIAVVFDKEQLTYKELNERANQLAHYLREKGIKNESLVPICLDRSLEMITGILAIMKAGAAYVPIDPAYPIQRIQYILKDTGASMMLSTSGITFSDINAIELDVVHAAIAMYPKTNLQIKLEPNNLAYVIYTSGSTGEPKGVMTEHKAVVNRLQWGQHKFKLTAADIVLQKTTFCFDVSVWELMWPLLNGARLVFAKPEGHKDNTYLKSIIEEQRISIIHFVPSMLEVFLLDLRPGECTNLQKVLCSGEALKASQVKLFKEKLSGAALHNLYGPTEAAIEVTCWSVPDTSGEISLIPIGKPVFNTAIYILDVYNELVPVGVVGEICIGGEQVARGYLNRDSLTAEKFINNPFDNSTGSRLYKTGDLGRWLADGNIEYIGRQDDQVKIRGYRIEPGEVEAVLQQHELVKQAVVVAKETQAGNKQLVAYVVAKGTFDPVPVLAFLQGKLPEYMVPALLIEVDNLPLTLGGKIDKRALPDPAITKQTANAYVAARNDIETALVRIWQHLLKVEPIGIHDNFFELGGHSLMAMRILSVIGRELEVALSVKELWMHPTIARLGDHLLQQDKSMLHPRIEVQPRPDRIPLSFAQERLWFIDQLEGSVQYHVPVVLRLQGGVNDKALEYAFKNMANRHEVLRTVFEQQGGQPHQRVLDKDGFILNKIADAAYANEPDLSFLIGSLVNTPFDLSRDHMIRAHLIRLGEEQYMLVCIIHHIASDGWSMPVIIKELEELYNAYIEERPAQLQPLEMQYADYAIWQRRYLAGEVLQNKMDWWQQQLAGVTPLNLPTDFVRPAIQSTRGALCVFSIDKDLAGQLHRLCREQEVTLFMTLLAVGNVLLHRYSGQEDICIGSAIANRTQQETAGLIGFFVNTLALRSKVTGDLPFTSLLQQTKETVLGAYACQDAPFEKVVETVVKERDLSRSPLCQVMFDVKNSWNEEHPHGFTGIQMREESYRHTTAKFDLVFSIVETPSGLSGSIEYCTDLYKEETIWRMAGHYQQLLWSVVASPAQPVRALSMLTAPEIHQLLNEYNATAADWPTDKIITDLFEAQVARTPDNTALVFGNEQITYKALNERANQLAHYLKGRGVQPGSLVPICMERGIDIIVGLLGILKAGGAYVPIDPAYPAERIGFMLQDTGASIVISNPACKSSIPLTGAQLLVDITGDWDHISQYPSAALQSDCQATDLAYVIYTSGSTGQPKGVMIELRAVVNLIDWHIEEYTVTTASRSTAMATVGFDAFGWEVWPYLCAGASIHLLSDDMRLLPAELVKYYKTQDITHTFIATALVNEFVKESGRQLPSLQYVLTGGDVLAAQDTANLNYRLVNNYGPTENTVVATRYVLSARDKEIMPCIGTPIANTQVYILDSAHQLTGIGIAGEICIGGAQVARGYLNRAKLTAEKFIPNPFDATGSSRLYKTGDLGRWLPDGNIEYIGRADAQVKIRGYRIELGEIERLLEQHEEVSQAVVVVKEGTTSGKSLVGYIVPEGSFDKMAVITWLQGKLPQYMIPAVLVAVEKMPVTANGKIDRKALPEIASVDLLTTTYAAPRNETEAAIAGIWQQLLQLDRVGINDNFFELGGHSLLAMRVLSALRVQLKIDLSVKDILQYATIARLAGYIQSQHTGEQLPAIEKQLRPDRVPLSFAQERLWFIDQLTGSVQYHIPAVFHMSGTLNLEALNDAFQNLVNRHEVLRTVIRNQEGKPYQLVLDAGQWQLTSTNSFLYKEDRNTLQEYITSLVSRPFDLSADHMIRAHLIGLAADEHILVLTIHHIAADGWSLSIIVNELEELYNACINKRAPQLAPLQVQYADYALWQRAGWQQKVLDKKLHWWRERLEGVLPLDLPTDYPKQGITPKHGRIYRFQIEKEIVDQLQQMGRQQETTLFMTLLAAFNVLLYRYSGQDDICIGSPVAGRLRQEVEGLIGCFINMLVLRNNAGGNPSFIELLQQVKATTLDAYEYQDVPFEKIVEAVVKERDLHRSPLFELMFYLQPDVAVNDSGLEGITLTRQIPEHATTLYDLTFLFTETANGLEGNIEYCTELYSEETIMRMTGHFEQLLKDIIRFPHKRIGELSMLRPEEENQLLIAFNNTGTLYDPGKTIIELFEEQVAYAPNAIAVVFGDTQITWKELNERVNQLAYYLIEKGVQPEQLVPVCMQRGVEMVIGILGIVKAGAAYVPVDPEYPQDRIQYMLADTAASLVVTSAACKHKIASQQELTIITIDADWPQISQYAKHNLSLSISPYRLAYVIYTSGSTGQPKGVMIEHGNLSNFIAGMNNALSLDTSDHLLAITSVSFDISILELLWTLCRGIMITIADMGRVLNNFDRYVMAENMAMDFSLFYFSGQANNDEENKYDFLFRSTGFADKNNFSAIWLPERHFHEFGGLFPNPAVLGAAVAATTKNITIRSGSVVLPLNDVIRVAEEWSVVDNISSGRVALSIAPGWHADDFVLMPEHFAQRHQVMYRQIDDLKKLWQGGAIERKNGYNKEISIKIFPRPVQPDLPIWITSAGNTETFRSAGIIGANILTHLLGQEIEELEKNILVYKQALQENGHALKDKKIALMLHTYIGDNYEEVRAEVKAPFKAYLRSSVSLIKNLAQSLELQTEHIDDTTMDELLEIAFERYWQTAALLGTKESCSALVKKVAAIGVTEIACLIDFGIDKEKSLANLTNLNELRKSFVLPEKDHKQPHRSISSLQITPSYLSALAEDKQSGLFLKSLKHIIVGGEKLPEELARRLLLRSKATLYNVYGPTETTIWSTTKKVEPFEKITIGKPIANTKIYILDTHKNLCAVGVYGELYIGGDGVARGYLNKRVLTGERFIQDPFNEAGGTIYKTGDIARWLPNGELEIAGRTDDQIKLRGYRIEPDEIQSAMDACAGVKRSIVTVKDDATGARTLVGYVQAGEDFNRTTLYEALAKKLPAYMIPSKIIVLDQFPLTVNGKIDKKSLPDQEDDILPHADPDNRDALEEQLAGIWAAVLGISKEQVRSDRNFFEMGGNSLKIIQLANDLSKAVQKQISVADLFQYTNIKSLLHYIRKLPDEEINTNSFNSAELVADLNKFQVD